MASETPSASSLDISTPDEGGGSRQRQNVEVYGVTCIGDPWVALMLTAPPNKRLQLALRPVGRLPLLRGDCEFRSRGGHELIAFVRSCAARFLTAQLKRISVRPR